MDVISILQETFKGIDLKITEYSNEYQYSSNFKIEFNDYQLYKIYTGLLIDAKQNYNHALDLYRTGRLSFNELKDYNYTLKEIEETINNLKT